MCFVWIWEQTTIISLNSINWLAFRTETECLLRGTGWIFKYIRLIIVFAGVDIHDRPQAMNCTVNISWNQLLLQHSLSLCGSSLYGLHPHACTKRTASVPLNRTKAHCSPFCSSSLQIYALCHKPPHNMHNTTATFALGKRISSVTDSHFDAGGRADLTLGQVRHSDHETQHCDAKS